MKKILFLAAAVLFSCKSPGDVQEITIQAADMERTAGTKIMPDGVLIHGSGKASEDGITVKIPFRDFSVTGRFKNSNIGDIEAPLLKIFIQGREIKSLSVENMDFSEYSLGSFNDVGDFLSIILVNDTTVRDSSDMILSDVNATIESLTFKIL